MTVIKEVIAAEIEQSEAHRDLTDAELARGVRRNRPKAAALSLRLDPDDMTEIDKLAREQGLPVSALVRGWILAGLAEERASRGDDWAAMTRHVAELSRIVERYGR